MLLPWHATGTYMTTPGHALGHSGMQKSQCYMQQCLWLVNDRSRDGACKVEQTHDWHVMPRVMPGQTTTVLNADANVTGQDS